MDFQAIKTVRTRLYRADMKATPSFWDISFKNDTYIHPEKGPKNSEGMFFFFDSPEEANSVGANTALATYATDTPINFYNLTSINEGATLNVIDFSECRGIDDMLNLLYSIGIDVLTNEFKTIEKGANFAQFRDAFHSTDWLALAERRTMPDVMRGIVDAWNHDYEVPRHQEVALFGQRLSDFENASVFKRLVLELYPDIDGYRWQENNMGLTYGIFDATKLPLNKTVKSVHAFEYLRENGMLPKVD